MIYEMRTYTIKPRTLAEFERRMAERLPARLELSQLGGFWHTEVGPLNQVVHIWPYEDLNQRADIRARAASTEGWPPDNIEFLVDMQTEILYPAPFMTPLGERKIGPLYEMRIYTAPPGTIPKVLEGWSRAIAAREKLSPLAGCWYSEIGQLNRWVHLWAYKSFEERLLVREEGRAKGIWPLSSGVTWLKQENKILFPADFSPMQ